MASADDLKVTLRVDDRISPTIRRIGRKLWWMQYGAWVTVSLVLAVIVLASIASFLLGRLSA